MTIWLRYVTVALVAADCFGSNGQYLKFNVTDQYCSLFDLAELPKNIPQLLISLCPNSNHVKVDFNVS